MLAAINFIDETYTIAWIGLLALCSLLAITTIALRWRPERKSEVILYDPPKGISPALAAFLYENGRYERAFGACIVSLAARGYLAIEEKKDRLSFKKLRAADATLEPHESIILSALFAVTDCPSPMDASDCYNLRVAFREFQEALDHGAARALVSHHSGIWICGLVLSFAIVVGLIPSLSVFQTDVPIRTIVYLAFYILLGGFCLVSAIRVWPVTLRKLISIEPKAGRPHRPLSANDVTPLILTCSALLGLGFLAYLTSKDFALIVASAVILNAVFRHLLEAPTRSGRRVLADLMAFRHFLARADADRLNRENSPGRTPEVLEKFSAYAVALKIDRSWGEELTANLLEMLEINSAYRFLSWSPRLEPIFAERGFEEPLELDTKPKKKTPKQTVI